MGADAPLVSVIIPTLNAGTNLLKLLRGIEAQQVDGGIEVIVIDSGSRDGTQKRARDAGASVVSIPRQRFNHGRTRNLAIQASRGMFVALTVQDAEPCDEFWIARLLAPLLGRSRVAGSYGLQVARATSSLLAKTRAALWLDRHSQPEAQALDVPQRFSQYLPEQRMDLIRFDNVTSCVRRSMWEMMPFSECEYGEDMAWAKQVLFRGYEVAYVPTAQVWHAHERGWVYEFRRAYVDGSRRVDLVQWPSLPLTLGDVAALLRRMAFFLRTRRFDSVCGRAEAMRFLSEEVTEYESRLSTHEVQVYLDILSFAWNLTNKAFELAAPHSLEQGAWIELLRFATVSVVGQNLGASGRAADKCDVRAKRIVWGIGSRCMGRGI